MRMAILFLAATWLLVGCKSDESNPPPPKTEAAAASPAATTPAAVPAASAPAGAEAKAPVRAGLANPASVNCGKQGGKTVIRKDAKGGEVGYCVFSDGSECEEWALMRGKCKPGQNKPAK